MSKPASQLAPNSNEGTELFLVSSLAAMFFFFKQDTQYVRTQDSQD